MFKHQVSQMLFIIAKMNGFDAYSAAGQLLITLFIMLTGRTLGHMVMYFNQIGCMQILLQVDTKSREHFVQS